MTRRLARLWPALLGAACLSAIDGFAHLTFTGRSHLGQAPLAWFDATAEGTIPTWFSVLSMAAVGIACLLQRAAPHGTWRLMGVLFCCLAVDDLCGLHESFGALLHPWLAGLPAYAWVATLGPVLVGLGLVCCTRLWRALAGEPSRRSGLVAGFAVLGLALALEALEETVGSSSLQPRGIPLLAWTQWLEESCEMLGPMLLLAATLPLPAVSRPGVVHRAPALAGPTVRSRTG